MNDIIIIKEKVFPTLVAVTDTEQERGLMFKEWPPPIMSFPFSTSEQRKFWMKNTPSPLDIIFCMSGKIIEIYNGNPNCENLIGPDNPTDLVVEMPAGMVGKYGISSGDTVSLKYSIATLAKHYMQKLAITST